MNRVPQDSKVSKTPVFEMLQLSIAAELALDRLACRALACGNDNQAGPTLFHGCSAGHPAQYAPHLYEPELNLLTDRHHEQLLRNGCPAVRYQHTGKPASSSDV